MKNQEFYVRTKHTGIVLAKMERSSYHFNLAENGDIVGIEFGGDKIGYDYEMFQSIAPYVKDGSFIEMLGEDGTQWRWVFENGKCREVNATVTWE